MGGLLLLTTNRFLCWNGCCLLSIDCGLAPALLAVTTVILTFIAGGSGDGNSFDLQLSVFGRGVRERYGQAVEHGRSSKVAWTLGSPIFSSKAFCRVEQKRDRRPTQLIFAQRAVGIIDSNWSICLNSSSSPNEIRLYSRS